MTFADEEPKLFVTGTTPFLHRKDSNPFAPDRTSQAPYVHWTCYHGDDLKSKSTQLHCCQAIYQMIQTDQDSLRWRAKHSVPPDYKFDKKDFMQFCTKNLRPIPAAFKNKIGSISARYTLFRVPEGMKLKIRNWSQIFGSVPFESTDSETPTKQWSSDDVLSPITLSRKGRQLLIEKDDEEIKTISNSFGAAIKTIFAADEDNDTKRYLRHTLTLKAIPEIEASATIEMNILLFLPEGVALGKNSRGVTSCQLLSALDSKCEVDTRTNLSTKTSLTQLDVATARLSASIPVDSEENELSFQWMTQLILEDDENYMIPAPIIHYGQLEIDDKSFEFDGEGGMSEPIVTDLDEAWWGDEL